MRSDIFLVGWNSHPTETSWVAFGLCSWNGEALDLEERARVTPGVEPGCGGHCSSYGDCATTGTMQGEAQAGSPVTAHSSALRRAFCSDGECDSGPPNSKGRQRE